jgi:hypothetical protein
MLDKQRDLDMEFDAAVRRVLPFFIYSESRDRDELARLLRSLAHDRLTTHTDSFGQIFSSIENYIRIMGYTLPDEVQKDISNLETYMMGISDSIGDLRIRMSNLERSLNKGSFPKKRGRPSKYAPTTELIQNTELRCPITHEVQNEYKSPMVLEKPESAQTEGINYMEADPEKLEPYVQVRGRTWNVYEYIQENLSSPKYRVIQCIIDNSPEGILSSEIERITEISQVSSILSKLKYNDPEFGKFIGVKYDRIPRKRGSVPPGYYWKLPVERV